MSEAEEPQGDPQDSRFRLLQAQRHLQLDRGAERGLRHARRGPGWLLWTTLAANAKARRELSEMEKERRR